MYDPWNIGIRLFIKRCNGADAGQRYLYPLCGRDCNAGDRRKRVLELLALLKSNPEGIRTFGQSDSGGISRNHVWHGNPELPGML